MKRLPKKIVKVLEDNGFTPHELCQQNGQVYIELNSDTPAGEDWWKIIWFDGTKEGFIHSVEETVSNFDLDERVEPFIECRGQRGAPESVVTLVHDAEWKLETLETLVIELNKLL